MKHDSKQKRLAAKAVSQTTESKRAEKNHARNNGANKKAVSNAVFSENANNFGSSNNDFNSESMNTAVDFSKKSITVLYTDAAVAVVYKPHGLLSVGYEGSKTRTAIDELEAIMRKNGTYSRQCRPLAVHRLDRETSGVLLFALTENAQKTLVENWQTMVKKRTYRAVAENPHNARAALNDAGTIDLPLSFNAYNQGFVQSGAHTPKSKNAPLLSAAPFSEQSENAEQNGGKTVRAVTHYRFVARGSEYSLLELELDTGKKNQIRAHLAHFGYPLAGDTQYRAKTDPFGRVALHARTLAFEHPITHQMLCFEVPEPKNWLKIVTRAKGRQSSHGEHSTNHTDAKKESLKSFEARAQKCVQTKEQRKALHKQDFIARGKSQSRKGR